MFVCFKLMSFAPSSDAVGNRVKHSSTDRLCISNIAIMVRTVSDHEFANQGIVLMTNWVQNVERTALGRMDEEAGNSKTKPS